MNMVSANHIARDAKSCTKLGVQILKLHVTTEALGFWGTAYLHGKALQGLLLALCAWPPTSLTLHIHFFFFPAAGLNITLCSIIMASL